MTTPTETLIATVAAAGFAVQAVPPVPSADKRLMADGFLVDTSDGIILRHTTVEDVEQSHLLDDDGECYWADEVVGIYQVKSGVMTPCNMRGWAADETRERRDDADDAKYRASLKYE